MRLAKFKEKIKKINSKQWQKLIFWLINLFLFSLPFFWAAQDVYKIGGDDSRFYLYAPWEWFKNIASYSWASGLVGGFGTYNPQFFYIPFNFFATGVKYLLPFLNHERVIYGLVLVISFSSIYSIIGEFIFERDNWKYFLACALGGFTYVFFPLVNNFFWTNPPNYFFIIILYPLLFLFFLKAIRQKRISFLIYGAIISSLLSMSLFNPPLLIPFGIGFGLFLVLYLFFLESKKIDFLKYLFIYIILILLLNSFFILPFIHSMFTVNLFSAGAFNTDALEGYVKDGILATLASGQQLIDHLSMQPSVAWSDNNFGNYFYYIFSVLHLGLILIVLIFIVFLFNHKLSKERKILTIVSFVFLVLVFLETVKIGDWGIKLFGWLVIHVPGFYSIRWFFIKTAPSYAIFYSLGVGLGIYIFLKNIKKRIVAIIIIGSVFLIITMQSLPFITGRIFNKPIAQKLTWNAKLPESYLNLVNFFRDLDEDNRIITFPLGNGSWSMIQSADSSGIYIGSSPLKTLANKSEFNSILSFANFYNPTFSRLIYNSIINQEDVVFKKVLGFLNIRYLVYNYEILNKNTLDHDFVKSAYLWFWQKRQDKGKYEGLFKKMGSDVREFDGFKVYQLDDNYFQPHIYSPTNIFYFDGDIDRLSNILFLHQYEQNNALYYTESIVDEKAKNFFLNKASAIWVVPYNTSDELNNIYRKMRWGVYDPGTLAKYLDRLEIVKKILVPDDYILKISDFGSGKYQIFIRRNSILFNNLNQGGEICFNDQCFRYRPQSFNKANNEDEYFLISDISLAENEYKINIKIKDKKIATLAAGDLILFKANNNNKINPPKIEFKRINSIKYRIKVKEATEPFLLVFNESFHNSWKLYLGSADSSAPINNDYRDKEIAGSIENRGLLDGKFYETYFKEPIAEDKHFLVNTYANAWWIDLNDLEKNGRIKKDENGNYNFDLIIEFQPQRIFYLSAAISGLTLFGCIIYLVFVYSTGKYKDDKRFTTND